MKKQKKIQSSLLIHYSKKNSKSRIFSRIYKKIFMIINEENTIKFAKVFYAKYFFPKTTIHERFISRRCILVTQNCSVHENLLLKSNISTITRSISTKTKGIGNLYSLLNLSKLSVHIIYFHVRMVNY